MPFLKNLVAYVLLSQPESSSMQNMKIVDTVKEVAARHDCTPGQVALAWLHAQVSSHCFHMLPSLSYDDLPYHAADHHAVTIMRANHVMLLTTMRLTIRRAGSCDHAMHCRERMCSQSRYASPTSRRMSAGLRRLVTCCPMSYHTVNVTQISWLLMLQGTKRIKYLEENVAAYQVCSEGPGAGHLHNLPLQCCVTQ